MDSSTSRSDQKKLYSLLIVLLAISLFVTSTHISNAQETAVDNTCVDAPFSSASERKRVQSEDPDCFELRDAYETELIPDELPLQDTTLPTTRELVQAELISQLQQLVAILTALLEARR